MSEIPTEIIEQIIDKLSDDRKALVASLSVSHVFHGRARYHLFRIVTLSMESDFHQFISLCDISPVISSLVQSLEIRCYKTMPQLPSLPNVTSLHIRGPSNDVWQSNFPSTTSLMLEDVSFPTALSFRTWICAYPHLTSLSLSYVRIHHPSMFDAYALAQGPPLEFLSFADVNYNVYEAFLGSANGNISTFALHGLRKIRHEVKDPDDAVGLHKLLAISRATLRELHVTMNPFYPIQIFGNVHPDISQVPTVEFRMPRISEFSFSGIILWLSSCTPTSSNRSALMERLIIHLSPILMPSDFLESPTFSSGRAPLDIRLTDPLYCNPKVVQFNVGPGKMRQAVRDAILIALPKLHAVGRLAVVDVTI
ncbi:uncharacterized protein EV420DRAFT_539738 [Desarmillaria tabescens]|uniref:F-box domain-containing protein n=1 Tax=Armillaria tabescens TaxID=1929756 RepID=A0AA39K9L0_ARMTA|nr:uncharacterized protein EV420DRAFT_539738 [Desarmillaria tabescens]KAK0457102.1 hypothetical protein EV420DRAFT_539738 [Desarmillaria tabescens]